MLFRSGKPRKAKQAKVVVPPPPPSNEAPQPTAEQPHGLRGSPEPSPRDDIGPDSAAEAARLRVRVKELQDEKRCLEFKITGLEREVGDLKDTLATFKGTDDKWRDAVETHKGIIARLENENANLRAGAAAPVATATNDTVARIAELIGAHLFMDGFIQQALTEFAKEVVAAGPEAATKATNGMISGVGWVKCAQLVLTKINDDEPPPVDESPPPAGDTLDDLPLPPFSWRAVS